MQKKSTNSTIPIQLYESQERDVLQVLEALKDRDLDRFTCPYRYIVNFSDAGVGKTIETVEIIKRLNYSPLGDGCLVLCPKSLIAQWCSYLPEAVVKTYEWWRMNGEYIEYDCVILDEFHKLKNKNAQITTRVWNLRRRYQNTLFIGLTATPIRNKPTDMWSLLHVIGAFGTHPNYNGWGTVKESYWAFCDRYYNMVDNGYAKIFTGYKESTFAELMYLINSRVSPVRRELELSVPLDRVLVTCEMDDWQQELYKSVKKLIYEQLPADVSIQNALVRMLRLVQVSACPKTITTLNTDSIGYGCKFEMIKLLLDTELKGKNVVIFSRFSSVLHHLMEYLDTSLMYDGSLSDRNRNAVKEQFTTKGGVLLATIGAAGTGIDGLQHISHDMIFLDRDWSPNINYQAEARLYRTGQQNKVTVYELQIPHTIDQYVEKMLNKKDEDLKQLMEEILS